MAPLAVLAPARVRRRGPFAGRGPVFVERASPDPGVLVGEGLNGRRVFDLASLADSLGSDALPGEAPVVATDRYFVRTREPASVLDQRPEDWKIRFDAGEEASGHFRDFGGTVSEVSAAELAERARPLGRHLLECSGNSSRRAFGLIGVAEWSGVPIVELFASAFGNTSARTLVRVTGRDDHATTSRSSVPGAAWIFTIEQLRAAGAFLATGMNDDPLPPVHGGPLRLIVPGWYGCTAIKWVEAVEVVGHDAPATSQMIEFASRTHQEGRPGLAREYRAAEIDFAAMPIAVEPARGPGGEDAAGSGGTSVGAYRVVGLAWGRPEGVKNLAIRYRDASGAGEWQPVPRFSPPPHSSWSLWSHSFAPQRGGEYEISLRVADPGVRTRRLDRGDYARTVSL